MDNNYNSGMTKESVWACELSSTQAFYQWNVTDDLTDDDVEITRSLLVKHAVLGSDAKAGEVTVVQLETSDAEGEAIKQPILILRAGQVENCAIDVVIHQPGAKFSLVKGSGPVYIWGQLIEDFSSVGDLPSDEDDEEDEELAEEMNDLAKESAAAAQGDSKKRKGAVADKGNAKKAKVDSSGGALKDDESESDEEDDESEPEDDSPPKKGGKGKPAGKMVPAANAKAVRAGRKK